MIILSANSGFVTNSSSVVYHFPKEILENPDIKAFVKAFEIEEGYVGSEMMSRPECMSFAITKEQKQEIRKGFAATPYSASMDYESGPNILDNDDVVIVFSDEYYDITSVFLDMMQKVAKKMGLKINREDFH